jgi:hypothetical protein
MLQVGRSRVRIFMRTLDSLIDLTFPADERLCGLVVRVSGSGFDSPALADFLRSRGLERGPLSLVTTIVNYLKSLGRYSFLAE